MRVSLRTETNALDVQVTSAADTVTVADLFVAAGLTRPDRPLGVGDFRFDPSTPLDALDLDDGSMIVNPRGDSTMGTDDGNEDAAVVELVCIAGPGTGRRQRFGAGTFDVCQLPAAGQRHSLTPLFRITVESDGTSRVGELSGSEILVDGKPAEPIPKAGSWVAADRFVFRLDRLDPDRIRRRPAPTNGGRTSFVRPPRVIEPVEDKPVLAPKPPNAPRDPEPLSFLLLLLPLPVGLIMAFVFKSPFYLIFTGLSPIMAIGRNYDGKRKKRRQEADNEEVLARDLAEFATALDQRRAEAAERARQDRPDLAALAELARTGHPDLWRSRSTHEDFLQPVIGVGPTRWQPEILGDLATDALKAVARDATVLPMTPFTADLLNGLALGIVGPPEARRALAAGVVCHLVTEHGPGDVELALFLSPDSADVWDNLKWLPHLSDESGSPRLALTPIEAEHLAGRVLPEREKTVYRPTDQDLETPVPVFLVDSDDVVSAGVRPLASRFPRLSGRAVVLADTVDELPAFCTTVADVKPSGEIVVTDVMAGRRTDGIIGAYADREVTADISRALARFTDPESPTAATSLPEYVRLTDILAVDHTVDALTRSWTAPPPGCVSILGVAETGPMRVDFLADGPHALVGGTTGSGKSELLRSMIVSMAAFYGPDRVTFVLVDFKGGGAFDVFQDLPHNVGVVTDLDEHLSARALRCLQAELKYREHRLRDAGVSDLKDMPPDGDPLPRLLIVVDEFATLAAELPDFMTSLVDVAQRGRSLGIHMVLATQRPTGVVDAKIRANTNLRVALRVQDDVDSMDIIGAKSAADINRRHPGRAFARLGASELVGFQTALVSIHSEGDTGPPLHVDTFTLLPSRPDDADGGAGSNGGDSGRTEADDGDSRPDDLAAYVMAAGVTAERLGLPAPRVPWPDPLPSSLAAEHLLADADASTTPDSPQPWSTPYGLIDLPDEQCQRPAWWGPGDGNVIAYGIEPGAAPGAVATIVVGLAHRHSPGEFHLYVIDFAGSLAALRAIPHTGGYVSSDDDERLMRSLRHLESELDRRRRLVETAQVERIEPGVDVGEPTPLIGLVIANYGAVLEMFEELGEHGGPGRLAQIVRDGPALGVFVFIASSSERDVPNRVAQQIESKLIMRMADPNSYMMFGLKSKEVPDLVPGRAVDVRTKEELQIARFGQGDLRTAIASTDWATVAPSSSAAGPGPTPIEVLPATIGFADIRSRSRAIDNVWHLSVAISHAELAPVGVDLRAGRHAVVTGPTGSGKTTALKALAAAARAADPDAYVAVESARPEEWDDLRDELGLTDLEFLIAPDSPSEAGRRTLLIIDGIESVPVPSDTFSQLTAQPIPGFHIVVCGRDDSFRTPDPWVRSVCSHRTGIVLQATPDHGDLFRCRFPTPKSPAPAGRGYVVNEGTATLAQIAVV